MYRREKVSVTFLYSGVYGPGVRYGSVWKVQFCMESYSSLCSQPERAKLIFKSAKLRKKERERKRQRERGKGERDRERGRERGRQRERERERERETDLP